MFASDKTGHILRQTLKERVVVTLKTGEAFVGVLLCADLHTWELVQAEAVGAGERGANVPVDGHLLIPAANVAYCQKP